MKLYVKCCENEEYVAHLSKSDCDDILDTVVEEVVNCIQKRYRNASVSVENINSNENTVSADIIIHNKGKVLISKKFEFSPYSDYFDYKDYLSHMTRTIRKFVKTICDR